MTIHTPERRFKSHVANARCGTKGLLADAIRNYGPERFVVEELSYVPWSDLQQAEIDAIAHHNTMWPNGLNATEGGNGATKLIPASEVARRKRMKSTMATKAYKKKQREIQRAVWTDKFCAARSASIKKMWEDPDYRARQMISRVRPRKPQKELHLVLNAGAVNKRKWDDPQFRAERIEEQKRYMANPDVRAKIAETQRRIMAERPEIKEQIALSLS